MARNQPPPPIRAQLTLDQMKAGKIKLERRIRQLRDFDPKTITQRDAPEVQQLEAAIKDTLVSVFLGTNTVQYNLYRDAAELDQGPRIMRLESSWIAARGGGSEHHDDAREAQKYVTDGIKRSILLLEQAVRSLDEEIADRGGEPVVPTSTQTVASRRQPSDALVPPAALEEIRRTLEEIKAQLPALAASNNLHAEITADVSQIGTEIDRPTPRRPLIKVLLEALRDHLMNVTADRLVSAVVTILGKFFGVS
jgi:hypothetical protein